MNTKQSKTISFHGKKYTLDSQGFLDPSEQWDKNFAQGMAKLLGIYDGLTETHWEFINYLRRKFIDEKTVPVVVYACTDNKLRLHKFRRLFPTGYHRGACKIAGINYKFMMQTNHWLTYETPQSLRSKFEMSSTGFLQDYKKWKIDFAHFIIQEWGQTKGLTDRHKKIIHYLRDYYETTQNIPTLFETCGANNLNLKELRELFPEGYRRGACRMAGLPFFA